MELLTKLGVNWQLLAAQIVNFLIVLGVLGYFVYKPVLALLDARSERIRKSMDDAKRIEHAAKEMEEIRTKELKKLDQEIGARFESARRETDAMREELLVGARKEVDQMLAAAAKRTEEERRAMMEDILKTVNTIVIRMTEKVLGREFNPADQKRIAESLTKELPALLS